MPRLEGFSGGARGRRAADDMVAWAIGCEAKSALSWSDPMPVVRSTLYRLLPANGEQKPAQLGEWIWSDL